ncbi:L-ascorbate metabolism protein UlaG (beta-lactamase superfamily) [Ciceribacter lividus]|uniref:L-ascorbate metabolism protein UlaG (Beta-lactamase superfamily) n=1 Tax=Ciceribacter lividus TaxID=1197950 RepID=A0A6I7HLL4_9HYPH|nr:MBL fold metallo-hydrolase [Ciceribacter lividus]RCW21918.1 L-ascorbate metabolism protein UlaG (beta-lactamase superfamily) [Ciceribacter lividus]
MMLRLVIAFISLILAAGAAGAGEERSPVSECQLVADALPKASFVRFDASPSLQLAAADRDVTITYLGHSTFLIKTPGGISIATDYNGWLRSPRLPDVVTMNKAHSSHYTLAPDPAIANVLHGWSDTPGEKAVHRVVVGDAYIRNVSTDIRSFGGFEVNGNSIFIFEVAGLCIGHLGHLHHELTDGHFAEIGRLDVVMVPVDGGLTMGADSMSRTVKRLRSALVLPMHRRGPPISDFLAMFDQSFDWKISDNAAVTVSMATLPQKPLILVLKGV